MNPYIIVAGNIGVGKSSLTTLLAQQLGWEPLLEVADENPYLADFYGEMQRWSFHSQVFFLSRKLRQHQNVAGRSQPVLQDRSVYEDAEIFARNLFLRGQMSERDWNTYYGLYESVRNLLTPPNLVIYLQAPIPTLVERINLRGREFEHNIDIEYLSQLNDLYDRWIASFNICPTLTITAQDLDFVRDPAHLDQIAQRVLDRLWGKEQIAF